MPNGTESSKSFGNINYGATTWLLRSASVTFYSGATRFRLTSGGDKGIACCRWRNKKLQITHLYPCFLSVTA